MNPQRQPLTNAMFEPEAPGTRERLDEIEQSLKAARPQPPRLDVAVLQRLAAGAEADTAVERPADRKSRSVSRRKRQVRDRVLVIAGSWACGAAVGALVMFAVTSRAAPENVLNYGAASSDSDAADSIAHPPIADVAAEQEFDRQDGSRLAVEEAEQGNVSSVTLTMTLDPLGDMDSTCAEDGPTLQAGMYLRQQAQDSMWPFAMTVAKERSPLSDEHQGHSGARTKSKPYSEPASAITPRELMREFLREAPGTVL